VGCVAILNNFQPPTSKLQVKELVHGFFLERNRRSQMKIQIVLLSLALALAIFAGFAGVALAL
jgi:hypothetical protein